MAAFDEMTIANALAELESFRKEHGRMLGILTGIGRAQTALEAEVQSIRAYSHGATLKAAMDALEALRHKSAVGDQVDAKRDQILLGMGAAIGQIESALGDLRQRLAALEEPEPDEPDAGALPPDVVPDDLPPVAPPARDGVIGLP